MCEYYLITGQRMPVRISTTSDNPLRVAAEGLIVEQLKRAGIKADPVNAPTATLLGQDLPAGNFDLALFASPSSSFPSDNAATYLTPGSGEGASNYDGYSEPKVDGLFV